MQFPQTIKTCDNVYKFYSIANSCPILPETLQEFALLIFADLLNSDYYRISSKRKVLYCQARVQVQGLSQISNKRPGPRA